MDTKGCFNAPSLNPNAMKKAKKCGLCLAEEVRAAALLQIQQQQQQRLSIVSL
jgi:hypothetical protein